MVGAQPKGWIFFFFFHYHNSLVNQDAAILILHLVVASNHTVNTVVVNQDIRNKIHKGG